MLTKDEVAHFFKNNKSLVEYTVKHIENNNIGLALNMLERISRNFNDISSNLEKSGEIKND